METRARYVLVGAFTLAVTAALFLFVYWLNNAGGLASRTVYQIRYQNSVAGLLIGSNVLFNGVRVGEVTGLDFVPDVPGDILVTIGVEPKTPVRKDTQASIEFQGLTGSAAVSLRGRAEGSADKPAGEPPMLIADPDSGRSMSEAARDALRRIDTLVADNADPLHTTITNLSKFSEALGRNSDRVDGVMGWLERMSGGKTQGTTYDLIAVRDFPSVEKAQGAALIVPEPAMILALSQDKIMQREGGSLHAVAGEARWSDLLANLFQARLIQSFENAKIFSEVGRPTDGLSGASQLSIDVRSFEIASGPPMAAVVELSAKLADTDGRTLGAEVFRSSVPLTGSDPASAPSALNTAFQQTAVQLVTWTASKLADVTKE